MQIRDFLHADVSEELYPVTTDLQNQFVELLSQEREPTDDPYVAALALAALNLETTIVNLKAQIIRLNAMVLNVETARLNTETALLKHGIQGGGTALTEEDFQPVDFD